MTPNERADGPVGRSLVLVSAKGAPGVTTSALLLAALWPVPAVLVEADPAGGDLRLCLSGSDGQPLRAETGVVSLLSAHNLSGVPTDRRLLGHAQHLPGGLPLLVGPGSPAQTEALRAQWPQLATALAASLDDVVIDAGRTDGQRATELLLLRAADTVLVVCRGTLTSVVHARDLLARLATHGVRAEVLLIGSSAQRDDTQRALGTEVLLLPHDPTAAAALLGQPWTRGLDRSPLVVAGRRVAAAVHERLAAAAGHPEAPSPWREAVLDAELAR